VVAHVKVVDGRVSVGDKIIMMSSKSKAEVVEVGIFLPHQSTVHSLSAGEVGYVATGLKNVFESRVGDTITAGKPSELGPLPGYRQIKPMVFAGIYPADGGSYESLRSGLEKLQLNDASLVYEPETSVALGVGFRCGFLGLLHMDIVQERLDREYGLDIIVTSPGVGYRIIRKDGKEVEIDNPSKLPNSRDIDRIMEPWLKLSIIAPSRFIGAVMELVKAKRGIYVKMEYITLVSSGSNAASPANDARVLLEYKMPMGEALMDFYDQLQSSSHGYASLDYSFDGYKPGDLVKLDILINGKPIDALSAIVPKNRVQHEGKALVGHLRNLIPRQLFEVAIQAAVGSRIMVSESVRALRKNVLAKCYGGDVTRKRKLLEKQAEGKKRLKRIGTVEVPQEAFLSLIKMKRDPS
jgi:GTP-binding protein LepA